MSDSPISSETPRPSRLAVFLASLDKTQYETPERMRLYQRRLLDRLLRHARAETDFYRDRLSPIFRADDSIDWERWQEIPILTRVEAQAAETALVPRSLPAQAGKAIPATTSGSTARPFNHFNTEMQNFASVCANERFFNWHGINPSKLAAAICDLEVGEVAYEDGIRIASWRPAHADSPGAMLAINMTVDKQLLWLRRLRPATLSTFPTNLRAIGEAMRSDGGERLQFDALVTTGEVLTEETERSIIADFGIVPINQYGTTEVGHIAASCPLSWMLHVSAELALIEILDEDGTPATPGTVGRVVATPFYNYATPLIRYDTGDRAAPTPAPCPCGRTLPLLQRIHGRSRNMFRLPDGRRIWPILSSQRVGHFLPHRQIQLVQLRPDLVEYRYVPQSADQVNDLEGLRGHAKSLLHPDIEIVVVPVLEIARPVSGKFEDCVSLVP